MIDLTIADDVATVVLNAPAKLNSLDEQALRDLGRAYDGADAAGVRALVLRGEDGRSAPDATSQRSTHATTT